ncbi:MAG TPA: GNAT family N-acetyltransferase [Candidatus Didemnitutus sp.]|jgi:predicted N-acetyltransferase YhbS
MNSEMLVRAYRPEDLPAVTRLFHDTVHQVNRADYTPEQLAAWAPRKPDFEHWRAKLSAEEVIVAESGAQIVGFCSWNGAGCLDFLYVHHAHQRQGIASKLYAAAEAALRRKALAKIHANVSLTAHPFFARQGFENVRDQNAQVRGVELPNAMMEKRLDSSDNKSAGRRGRGGRA